MIRRYYWQKGPCQPKNHPFPWKEFGNEKRRFIHSWFKDHSTWLEYSVSKEASYCLCCYLFKHEKGDQGGGDTFVGEGFTNWKKAVQKFKSHVGNHISIHNQCMKACEDLMNQHQHIEVCFVKQSEQAQKDYRLRLTSSLSCIRYLLRQGLAFRGHDESQDSRNQGNFIELLKLISSQNEEVRKVVLENAPENHKLISPRIQKDIVNAAAVETTNVIIKDIGNDLFSILVDEARDISIKEQMVVMIRYVNKKGCIVERFLGAIHVSDTTSLSLKVAIGELLVKHNLSLSSVRGQGYDGASNMRGEFNGLKSLILKENPYAFYVHCFAHQLQLALVGVVQKDDRNVATFFNIITNLSNVIGASCKRQDILREKQVEKLIEGIQNNEVNTGRGLNQELTLKRAGDTRWGSHYKTLLSLISLYPSVIDVLEVIANDGKIDKQRGEANMLSEAMQLFSFVFLLHLMKNLLGITEELSQALQRKDQDIVNAMRLVDVSKIRLQKMRDNGWQNLLNEVFLFCNKNGINTPDMNGKYVAPGRSRRTVEEVTNLHYYRVQIFYAVIDLQLQELNSRFNEVNTELLLCMACLDPSNSFFTFNKEKLIKFARFYPYEFSEIDLMALDNQLETYFWDVSTNDLFSEVVGISGLAQKMVETRKNLSYPLVYILLKLALILPVATASVERAFSAMNFIKTSLRNRMGDEWLNDCLVTYIEKEIFDGVTDEDIIQRFQQMANRRGVL